MENLQFKLFTPFDALTSKQTEDVVDFLYEHLQEYGDKKEDIERAINYAMQTDDTPGGFVVTAMSERKVVGAVVVNKTGMSGYIPENILVYIAVHADMRGHGVGKKLMKNALRVSDGDVALHVEPDNPARFLYENLGFTNKYLEMRWTAEQNPAVAKEVMQESEVSAESKS